MVDERRVRKVRKPDPTPTPARPATYLEALSPIIQGIVDMDAEGVWRLISSAIRPGGNITGSRLIKELDQVAGLFHEAVRLGARARREYEIYKEEHATWLELKKSAARIALEREKKEKGWKKQITQDMVLDQVRSSWPDEYAEKVRQLRNFQAAVHELEALPDAVKMRARAIEAQRDMLLQLGPNAGR